MIQILIMELFFVIIVKFSILFKSILLKIILNSNLNVHIQNEYFLDSLLQNLSDFYLNIQNVQKF